MKMGWGSVYCAHRSCINSTTVCSTAARSAANWSLAAIEENCCIIESIRAVPAVARRLFGYGSTRLSEAVTPDGSFAGRPAGYAGDNPRGGDRVAECNPALGLSLRPGHLYRAPGPAPDRRDGHRSPRVLSHRRSNLSGFLQRRQGPCSRSIRLFAEPYRRQHFTAGAACSVEPVVLGMDAVGRPAG